MTRRGVNTRTTTRTGRKGPPRAVARAAARPPNSPRGRTSRPPPRVRSSRPQLAAAGEDKVACSRFGFWSPSGEKAERPTAPQAPTPIAQPQYTQPLHASMGVTHGLTTHSHTRNVWLQTVQYQDKDFIFVPFTWAKLAQFGPRHITPSSEVMLTDPPYSRAHRMRLPSSQLRTRTYCCGTRRVRALRHS